MENTFEIFNKDYEKKDDNYYGNSRPEVAAIVPAHCRTFLDVGCSDGSFGAFIKKQRPSSEVWGIEPHKNSADKASVKLDNVLNTFFTEDIPDLQGRKFDCISFNDVLEHLFDPQEALETSKKFLSDDGVIVASIPNILFYHVFFEHIILKKDWKYTDGGTLDETHVRFFTKKSIERLFVDSGYEIVKLIGINKTGSKKFSLFNLATFNYFKEWGFMQFGIVAKKRKK